MNGGHHTPTPVHANSAPASELALALAAILNGYIVMPAALLPPGSSLFCFIVPTFPTVAV